MTAPARPTPFSVPFATSAGAGYITLAGGGLDLPIASQLSIEPGAASYTDGFPPLAFLPVEAGGVPPWGADFNAVLQDITKAQQWVQIGGTPVYSSAFASSIGGYPVGAIVQSVDGTGWWRNTLDGNASNPDGGGSNWLPHYFYGTAAVTVAGANITLSASQYCRPMIILTGTLTANVRITFPAIVGQWIVSNRASLGSYAVTAKAAGSGTGALTIVAGDQGVWCDGTDLRSTFGASYTPASALGGLYGFKSGLSIVVTTDTTVQVTLASGVLTDGAGNYVPLNALSQTVSTTGTGAGHLDTGSVTNNTWYFVYAIAKADGTQSAILSTSSSAPTLPSGYLYYELLGAVKTQIPGGTALVRTAQYGNKTTYRVTPSSQTQTLPKMVTGHAGDVEAGNYAPVAVSNFVPTAIASEIGLTLWTQNGGIVIVAPSSNYAGDGTDDGNGGVYINANNPPYHTCNSQATSSDIGPGAGLYLGSNVWMPLESNNIYWASSDISKTNSIFCTGWVSNL